VGSGLTQLPILASLIVEIVSASIITGLSQIGIPASLAVSATMCIVGLGWGRATRTTRLADAAGAAVTGKAAVGSGDGGGVSVNAIAADDGTDATANGGTREVAPIGEEEPGDVATAADLFDPDATGRVVMLWILTPTIAATASFLVFEYVPVF